MYICVFIYNMIVQVVWVRVAAPLHLWGCLRAKMLMIGDWKVLVRTG